MSKRGRYQIYATDSSCPMPKVSLWRQKRKIESEDVKDEENRNTMFAEIDRFHEEALKAATSEDPALIPDNSSQPASLFDETPEQNFNESEENHETDEMDVLGQPTTTESLPLYPGSTITVAASMVLIIAFAMRHSLTGEALSDLLVLIELHCLVPNLCQRSLKEFMDYFKTIRTPLEFHYYCEKCFTYFGTTKPPACTSCQTETHRKTLSYFLVIPVITQLQSLFKDGNLIQQIRKLKGTSRKDSTYLGDITDGKLYDEQFNKEGFFRGSKPEDSDQLHISFQLNTDGVSLFHSSSFSIWPVYIIVNELPPHIRFSRNNRIFAGLWFGYSKPEFRTFMRPFAESLHELYQKGFQINGLTVKGILLNCVFDAPARCLFQNMVQFNGYYGCPYCKIPGATVKTSEKGHTHAYPFNMESTDGCHNRRTQASFRKHAEEADNQRLNSCAIKPVFGVKGNTFFSFLPQFDIIRGVAIDYMHCIPLGVMKMLASLWFDKSYKEESFSLNKRLSEVEARFLAIQPPNFIQRLPRSLTEISHFKAAELKNFLLYYSVPCLYDIMPEDQLSHFTLLVYSVYILLKDKITKEELKACKRMLIEFVLNVPVYYSDRYMTSNVHLLLHLVEKVEDLGPLWASSCFYFEDYNGQLRRLFHGTQNIQSQISFAVCVNQQLPDMVSVLNYGSSELELFQKMVLKKTTTTTEFINDTMAVIGAYNNEKLAYEEEYAVFLKTGEIIGIRQFRRLLCRTQTVYSKRYCALRRNNSIIKYDCNFGSVLTFVKVHTFNYGVKFLAVVNVLKETKSSVNEINTAANNSHLIPVCRTDQMEAIFVDSITDVCICVHVNDNLDFVSVLPNRFEKE